MPSGATRKVVGSTVANTSDDAIASALSSAINDYGHEWTATVASNVVTVTSVTPGRHKAGAYTGDGSTTVNSDGTGNSVQGASDAEKLSASLDSRVQVHLGANTADNYVVPYWIIGQIDMTGQLGSSYTLTVVEQDGGVGEDVIEAVDVSSVDGQGDKWVLVVLSLIHI